MQRKQNTLVLKSAKRTPQGDKQDTDRSFLLKLDRVVHKIYNLENMNKPIKNKRMNIRNPMTRNVSMPAFKRETLEPLTFPADVSPLKAATITRGPKLAPNLWDPNR